jgi:glycogen(starch) synthase
MKVLMLGWELPPYNSGGLGIACYQMCKALSKKDIDIEFILPYQADHNVDFMTVTAAYPQDVKTFLASGTAYESHKFAIQKDEIDTLDIQDQQRLYEHATAKLVETRDYDVVHAHDWLTFRAALRVKALKNWPIILHVHSVESDRAGSFPGNPMVKDIEDIALHMADRVIAVSQHTKNAIIRDYNVPADKIEVVHNSMDVSAITPLDNDNVHKYLSLMKSLGYRVVVSIGRLTVQKGLPNLLEAAKKVIDKAPKTIFLIVGSGEQYYELLSKAAELGIGDKVLFADFQRGKNWRDSYAIGDLFVMPSVSEPFGLTPLEAIGYGTPALVSKQSGISEVLNNCLKVDFWDTDEMANKITSVMLSDQLRNELWQNSYNEFRHFSWDKASEKIIALYHSHKSGAVA